MSQFFVDMFFSKYFLEALRFLPRVTRLAVYRGLRVHMHTHRHILIHIHIHIHMHIDLNRHAHTDVHTLTRITTHADTSLGHHIKHVRLSKLRARCGADPNTSTTKLWSHRNM